MGIETPDFEVIKPETEKEDSQPDVQIYMSSPFDLELSPEYKAEKRREVIEAAQNDRARFLEEKTQGKWERIWNKIKEETPKTLESIKTEGPDYVKHQGPNYLPGIGSLKMMVEAVLKEKSSGEVLEGKDRVFHAIAGASASMFYAAMASDRMADTNLTKYGASMSVASTALTFLTSETGKKWMKKGFEYARKAAESVKDKAAQEAVDFLNAVAAAAEQLNLTPQSELMRHELVGYFERENG